MTKTRLAAVLISLSIPFAVSAADIQIYGKPPGGSDTVKISVLMADPGKYVGKTVRIEGRITDVCKKAGCWMSLASDDQKPLELRIKVDDGAIVFPVEARGKRALVEGEFTKVEMTMEQTLAHRKHLSEEQNEAFDPSSVKEPMTYYEIKATGALIR
ncbi:MAG: DUF4920 domain-containing protein [Candidatus Polarisedimenticolia bacterium]